MAELGSIKYIRRKAKVMKKTKSSDFSARRMKIEKLISIEKQLFTFHIINYKDKCDSYIN